MWGKLELEGAEHLVNASLFLLHVGMHVEVQRGAYVGMPQQHAYGLVVTVALNASGGKAVS